jgi:hypothetical protein
MVRALLASLVLSALALTPVHALAHALGASYEATIDGYALDIGFSSPAPEVGEAVIFDFNFPAAQDPVPPFTDVWVRIETDKRVVFASALHNARFGGPRMSYVFPEAGVYTIYVRYQNPDQTFVEATFPMTVVPVSEDLVTSVMRNPGYIVGALGLVLAMGMLAYSNRSRILGLVRRS